MTKTAVRIGIAIIVIFAVYFIFFDGAFNPFNVYRLKKLAEQGDGDACWCLTAYYEASNDSDNWHYFLRKGASFGEPHAQLLWGDILLSQDSTEQMKEGLLLLKRAAEQNYADAQIILGDIYSPVNDRQIRLKAKKSLKINDDWKQSEYWYGRAAKNGAEMGMYNLSKILAKKGKLTEAYKWTVIALIRTNPTSTLGEGIKEQQKAIVNEAAKNGVDVNTMKQRAEYLASVEINTISYPEITGGYTDAFYDKCRRKARWTNHR